MALGASTHVFSCLVGWSRMTLAKKSVPAPILPKANSGLVM